VRIAKLAVVISVQYRRHAPEHLQNEWFSVHQIKLLHCVLHGAGHQFVSLVIGVYMEKCRHDQQVAVIVIYLLLFRKKFQFVNFTHSSKIYF